MESYDVLVIGGGVAGATAALAAAETGARVLLVRRGPGATALSHGGWTGEPPAPLRDALARAGLEITACDGALPHPDGSLVHCTFAAAAHARTSMQAIRTIVCGIAGLPGFRAAALCALWADEAQLAVDVRPVTLTLTGTPAGGWSPVSLAALLERDPARLAGPLGAAARAHGAERAIVPAALGIGDHGRVLREVTDDSGVTVGEALGVPPSLPGWRLDRALSAALAGGGVRELHGSVAGGTFSGSVLEQVFVQRDDRTQAIGARAFVLATGKFLGGGITAQEEFAESALDLDVAIERFSNTIDDPGAALMLTDPVRTEPQPVLSTGVRVDTDGRPLNAAGDVQADNVFVAGSVRAGVETATLGLAAAAREGWRAGAHAAAHAGRAH